MVNIIPTFVVAAAVLTTFSSRPMKWITVADYRKINLVLTLRISIYGVCDICEFQNKL